MHYFSESIKKYLLDYQKLGKRRRKFKLPVIQFGFLEEYDCGRDGQNKLKGENFGDRKMVARLLRQPRKQRIRILSVIVILRGGLK